MVVVNLTQLQYTHRSVYACFFVYIILLELSLQQFISIPRLLCTCTMTSIDGYVPFWSPAYVAV